MTRAIRSVYVSQRIVRPDLDAASAALEGDDDDDDDGDYGDGQ
jgi:hypothetical protein